MYLNYKSKQIGFEIEISSDLLENVCTSEFEGTSNMKCFWANSLPSHSPISWNHKKLWVFNRKFFLITILAKSSILDVWQGSEYTNEYGCKILAKRLLMRTEKHKNKGVYWYEKSYAFSTYSRLHCIQFHLLDFSSAKIVFFISFITFCHSFYRYCHCQE